MKWAEMHRDIREILEGMSVREKVGQLLMGGFGGTDLNARIEELVRELFMGGIILFRRNLPQEVSPEKGLGISISIDPGTKPGTFVSIDQEGGRVARLQEPFTVPPAAALLGERGSPEEVYGWYARVAQELRGLGINMNMAPVLDVHTNPLNPVIGDRSFGSDPQLVARMGKAAIRALQDHGVIAVGKHFPGHGDTSLDSHLALPQVNHSRQRMEEVELVPFREAIAAGVRALMTAHVVYPQLDPDRPATLSPRIIRGILRQELGFQGVVISDDLEMKAIEEHYPPDQAAVLAFQAGVDLLLFCHTRAKQQAAYAGLLQAVESGEIPLQELDKAVDRILRLKRFILGG